MLLPQNIGQIEMMAKELKKIGIDYFTIKPYMSHILTDNTLHMDYSEAAELEKCLKQYETEEYHIYFRISAMEKLKQCKAYRECYALPFMIHIDAKGNVWPCVEQIGREGFCYGNIYQNTFEEIWKGEERRKVIEKISHMDLNENCGGSCRLDEMNRYLWELKYPGGHVNFI